MGLGEINTINYCSEPQKYPSCQQASQKGPCAVTDRFPLVTDPLGRPTDITQLSPTLLSPGQVST